MTCINGMVTCTADPCWRLWLHSAGTAINSRLGVTLIGVGAAAALAWWYQRRNKIMEFRFDTFKDMAANMADCCLQAKLVRAPTRYLEDMARLGGGRAMGTPGADKQAAMLEEERARLTEMANAGFKIWHRLHPPIFSGAVSTPWFKMNKFFRQYAEDPIGKEFNDAFDKAMGEGSEALSEARKELGMPYKTTKLMAELERKHAEKEPQK